MHGDDGERTGTVSFTSSCADLIRASHRGVLQRNPSLLLRHSHALPVIPALSQSFPHSFRHSRESGDPVTLCLVMGRNGASGQPVRVADGFPLSRE